MKILSPIRIIAAALFALSALLGAPNAQDAPLSIGTTAAAAQEVQTEPHYWQMYYNYAPPTDEFIAGLAAEQGVAYTPGKKGEARFYADDGRPIYPSNDGAVGVIVTVTLPAGDLLTRYGKPTGRYVSPDGVQNGKIAPWFGRTGGGIQYKLPDRIVNLMEASMLREVDLAEEKEAA